MARCTDCQRECDCTDPKCRGYHARSGCTCSRCANAFIAGEPKRLTLVEMFDHLRKGDNNMGFNEDLQAISSPAE